MTYFHIISSKFIKARLKIREFIFVIKENNIHLIHTFLHRCNNEMIILEPSAELVSYIRQYLPAGAYRE